MRINRQKPEDISPVPCIQGLLWWYKTETAYDNLFVSKTHGDIA